MNSSAIPHLSSSKRSWPLYPQLLALLLLQGAARAANKVGSIGLVSPPTKRFFLVALYGLVCLGA